MDDAIARYRTATEAGDVQGVLETLSPNAELLSPISNRLVFRGKDDLRVLLTALLAGISDLRWNSEIGEGSIRVVMGEARVGPFRLGDAMLVELAPDGRIQQIRPHLRPWLGLTVLALRLGPKVLAHPAILWRAMKTAGSRLRPSPQG